MLRTTIFLTTALLLTSGAARGERDQHHHKSRGDQADKFQIDDVNTVDEAVEQIRSILEGQGFDIVATINHAAAAASVNRELRPTTVLFASHPFFDRTLIRRSQIAALDLPPKFLVFEDEQGEIQLRFNDEGSLVDRHQIPQRDRLLGFLDSLLNQFGRLDQGVIMVESNHSVEDTVDTLFALLDQRGFRIPIPGGIDFSERAGQFGGKFGPTKLLVFGNPDVGTPLMQNEQSIGLDLPQKFLVFEDPDGDVFIAFNDPLFLARKHNLQRDVDPNLETRLQNISNALLGLAEAAANTPPIGPF